MATLAARTAQRLQRAGRTACVSCTPAGELLSVVQLSLCWTTLRATQHLGGLSLAVYAWLHSMFTALQVTFAGELDHDTRTFNHTSTARLALTAAAPRFQNQASRHEYMGLAWTGHRASAVGQHNFPFRLSVCSHGRPAAHGEVLQLHACTCTCTCCALCCEQLTCMGSPQEDSGACRACQTLHRGLKLALAGAQKRSYTACCSS
jgi:hypothetical protein